MIMMILDSGVVKSDGEHTSDGMVEAMVDDMVEGDSEMGTMVKMAGGASEVVLFRRFLPKFLTYFVPGYVVPRLFWSGIVSEGEILLLMCWI
jgi:hypothetical protein